VDKDFKDPLVAGFMAYGHGLWGCNPLGRISGWGKPKYA
jgi:hypothetical protein